MSGTYHQKQRTIDRETQLIGPGKSARVDLGLELLRMAVKPGEELSRTDLAAWCGCSNTAIEKIERNAINKIRNKLGIDETLFHFFDYAGPASHRANPGH